MINRNIILEGRVKSWLNNVQFEKMNLKEQAMLLQAVEVLYKATQDEDYKKFVMAKADQLVSEEGEVLFIKDKSDIDNLYMGNALVFAMEMFEKEKSDKIAASCGADSADIAKLENKYKKAVCNIAEQLNSQKKNEAGIFVSENAADESLKNENAGILADTYKTQAFYMNYETLLGGKERYNDIIAQFNNVVKDVYKDVADKLAETINESKVSDSEEYASIAEFACALIDTMEVMAQPIYEVYDKLKEYYKNAVKLVMTCDKNIAKKAENSSELLKIYAVLKGCRMKALHTEKYEKAQLDILAETVKNAENNFDSLNQELKSALVMAYAESLRNREYQDYGRNKGGVLWS